MKKDVKLYNIIFPMWSIYFYGMFFVPLWLILLPANFIVDSLVLLLLFWKLELAEKKSLYKKSIWKTWGVGFLADVLASSLMVFISWTNILPFNEYLPISSVPAFLFTTAGVVLAGFLIYFFHIKWVWNKIEIEEKCKRKIALGMAVLTAPYLMFLPPLGGV